MMIGTRDFANMHKMSIRQVDYLVKLGLLSDKVKGGKTRLFGDVDLWKIELIRVARSGGIELEKLKPVTDWIRNTETISKDVDFIYVSNSPSFAFAWNSADQNWLFTNKLFEIFKILADAEQGVLKYPLYIDGKLYREVQHDT